MGYKDLHEKPFDEGTIAKLEIFQDYANAWVPTFLMVDWCTELHIFDFFAGTGYDKAGIPGSPLRTLEVIKSYRGIIFNSNKEIHLHFNEFDSDKLDQLKKSCSDFLNNEPGLAAKVLVSYYNLDFDVAFTELSGLIKKQPSLVYIDQNGVKFANPKYLLELEKYSTTDVLYFISSSYIKRFGKTEEFQQSLGLDLEKATKCQYRFIHKEVLQALKAKLPPSSNFRLYPFSIKKGANIYGIIFGSKHPRAVDKFLKISWDKNQENGEANFDLYHEDQNSQVDIFTGCKLSKVQSFQEEVRTNVLAKKITSNIDLLSMCYDSGHIGNHAAEVLKKLKKEGSIQYKAKSPKVNYESVFKKKELLLYELV